MAAGLSPRARPASRAARKNEGTSATVDLGGCRGNGDLPFADGNAGHAGLRRAMFFRQRERNGLGTAVSDRRSLAPDSQQRIYQTRKPDDGPRFHVERFKRQARAAIGASRKRSVAELLGYVVCTVQG